MSALHITTDNYTTEVENSTIPVLLDFWAEWCPPCKMISPIIDELADKYEGKIKIAKVNIDECKDLAQKFNVSSIPTIILMNKGEIIEQQVGALPKASIEDMLQSFVK